MVVNMIQSRVQWVLTI